MARLEDLTSGSIITGILANEPITVVSTKWYGTASVDVYYKTNQGTTGSQILYREDEPGLTVLEKTLPWSFDVEANQMRLVSEAYRIHLAHLFDPYLAVHTSAIEPLPHQISAVYEEMLPRLPLRYVLADDPGAGKTIMTGLLLKELIIRGDLKRCMIVCPGNLAEQWQDELYQKFHLRFEILTNDRLESAVSGNVFTEINYCIARLDKLARNDELQEKLKITDWDLIVCDEAHKMSATVWGNEVHYTKRFQLGRLLSNITRHFLLLTATPHNGKEEDFQYFMSLIDPDRFEGICRTSNQSIDVSDVMRRLVKEDLLKFDGTPLFPERLAYTVNYDLSPLEGQLYTAVTTYVEEEFNRADQLSNERRTSVGFALTILQRRLASSPEAIYQSLHRRRERLEQRLREEQLGKRVADMDMAFDLPDNLDEMDDLPSEELEEVEARASDRVSAARTIEELRAEIETLRRLEAIANNVRMSGTDKKWEQLSSILQDDEKMFDPDGQREKLIIFTEHRDTLNYLAEKIRTLFGKDNAVVTIHGGMLRDERRKVETLFKQDKDVRIMIATDAAGEGINLQRAHLMVNYDLPWNPNRIEQRFGRIHRIGQTEVCHLWNLVSKETREGAVYQRLFEKLDEERKALGGKVFDILGDVTFDNRPLRDLLIEAIRYGNRPETKARLYQVVDKALNRQALRDLIDENALTEDTMDVHRVMAIREEMERMEAHKLQPHFIEAFFIEAFTSLGGVIRKREEGRYEIISVPYKIRNRDQIIGFGTPVAARYERICFDKEYCNIQGQPTADQVCPGHPLLEATIDLIREQNADVMKRGAIMIDENDPSEQARLLFYMKGLLTQALRRVGGLDGEPVIQLKTAFGGGKTHSMLALYHMLRGRTPLAKVPNVKAVVDASGIDRPPICRVAVLVGTSMDPSRSKRPSDMPGITVNTLWGEMAYQLAKDAGVPKLYDIIKESDKKGVSPGSETLKSLFNACGPCVILIDELVAYAKKLWHVDGLPAGSFDNMISFIQEITEAARASENSLVVASIPESNIEIGGEGGRQALEAIEHTFGRMEAIWKPVAANEGFEIVRRRLFLNCKDEAARDASCMAFSQMYQENTTDFPTETKEVDYLNRMKACYPLHPEIFDRLYEDWATIERFQKTRGVLRLMAAVVHKLWMAQDASLMIMPGSVNLDEANIRDELTRYVGDEWNPIVDHEVDGRQSIPYQKDQSTQRFGRIMAARRVARTIMLGSAPSARSNAIKGIETSRIRLGVVQPGENIAIFNDALNTLQGALSYLYSNPTADRFWYDTRPTLRKTVEDRASQRSEEEVEMELERRLKQIRRVPPFARLHICPESSMDVSDDQEIGLVILKYRQAYRRNEPKDMAIAREIVKTGDTELVEMLYGSVPNTLSELIRTALIPKQGCRFIVADFSAIEARVLAWLAGEEWVLEEFRGAGKIYEATASRMYHVPKESIVKGNPNYEYRQKGKQATLSCIAESELVLTDHGLIPIEKVSITDRVWDGEAWVHHDGVIFQGVREVITYGGLTATKDHLVWIEGEQGPVQFGFAASRGAHLIQTGHGRTPIWLGQSHLPGEEMVREMESMLYSDPVCIMRCHPMDRSRKPSSRSVERLPELFRAAKANTYVAGQETRSGKTALPEPKGQAICAIWRTRHRIQIPICNQSRYLDSGKCTKCQTRIRTGPYRHKWALRAREYQICSSARECLKSSMHSAVGVGSEVLAVFAECRYQNAFRGEITRGDHRVSTESCSGETEKLAQHQRQARVYDIRNAGPHHRFTVSGHLVHNCGYGGGVGALKNMGAKMPEDEMQPLVDAWRAANPHIVGLWNAMDRAMRKVIREHSSVRVGKISLYWRDEKMLIRLPSGRELCYLSPRTVTNRFGSDGIGYMAPAANGQLMVQETFGGKACENVTQATARDILAHAMLNLEAHGYSIVFHVHDECVMEMPEGTGSVEEACAIMGQTPEWCSDLPLRADGYECRSYRKA